MTSDNSIIPSGLQAHSPTTAAGALILARQKLTLAKLDEAIALHELKNGANIGTLIGVSEPGIIFSQRAGWDPSLPDAFDDLGIIPWILAHELLGNVPEGSMGEFIKSGGSQ